MPTVQNLRYPAATDTPDVPRDIGNLATDVAARTPYAFYATAVNVTTTGSPSSGTAVVTFPGGLFSSAGGASPIIVTATIQTGAGGATTATTRVITAPTASNVTVGLSNVATAGTYSVHVIAIQDNP
jgi:hypothetical protein